MSEREENWEYVWTSTTDDTMLELILKCSTLAAIPAFTMLIGGLTVFAPSSPSKRFVFAMQHFAAGMLICSIAQELVPPLTNAKSANSFLGLLMGFALGVALMVGVEAFVEEHDEPNEGTCADTMLQPAADGAHTGEESERSLLLPQSIEGSQAGERTSIERASSAVQRAYTIRERMRGESSPSFPWVFATAVYVDSLMDGLLIGVAIITGKRAGLIMALALGVEMGFLGITFAQSIASLPKPSALLAVVAGPLFLMLGAIAGGALTHVLSSNPAALVSCTAFGVSALLYMVCEELLVSAHESGEDHVWWIDLQVYVGFLFSLSLEKVFDLFPPS